MERKERGAAMKQQKSALKIATIVVAACLIVATLGSYLVQTSFFTVKQTVITTTLNDLVAAINENNEKNGKDYGRTLTVGSSNQISMTVFKPANASAQNKVPAIICVHGNCNTKEMQLMNFVELTKRGFAVVAVDTATHGRTDAAVINEGDWNPSEIPFSPFGDPKETVGVLAAAEYAMSLDFVDETKVGATGHSGGNIAITGMILQLEDYRLQYEADPDNVPKFSKKISAFYCPAGTAGVPAMVGIRDIDGFILGTASGRYDELDTIIFGTHDMTTAGVARSTFDHFTGRTEENSFIAGKNVPLGEYWNKDGRLAAPNPGEKLSADSAVVIYNPDYTHPGAMYSAAGGNLMINFFYAAYGVPSGAKYIPGTSQTWQIAFGFQILGLLAFLASAFVVGAWMLKRRIFAPLNADYNGQNTVVPHSELPSIKSWREFIPLIITFVPIVYLCTTKYVSAMNTASSHIKITSYFDAPVSVAWYTLICGLISFAMISVNYLLKKLCYIKSDVPAPRPVIASAELFSVKQFLLTVLYAVEVIAVMYIPQIIAYYGFDVIFCAAIYGVGVPRLIWLPQILLIFFPMWLVYTTANGALNAATRFKELPEWATTLFCVIMNVLPAVILVVMNYTYLKANGQPILEYLGNPAIYTWTFLAPMIFIGLTGRFFYKKTGNIWAGALINAGILSLMVTTLTKHMSDVVWVFIK